MTCSAKSREENERDLWSFAQCFLCVAAVPECEVRREDQRGEEAFTAVHIGIIAAAVGLVAIITVVAIICVVKKR